MFKLKAKDLRETKEFLNAVNCQSGGAQSAFLEFAWPSPGCVRSRATPISVAEILTHGEARRSVSRSLLLFIGRRQGASLSREYLVDRPTAFSDRKP